MFRISVVVPYFNNFDTIENCLKSIFDQECSSDFQIREIILIDDGSEVPFPGYTHESETKIEFKALRKENGGAASARNLGILHTKDADFIAFLDADDAWLPHKTQVMMSAMLSNNATIAGSLSQAHKFHTAGNNQDIITISYWEQLKTNRFLTSTTIVDVRKIQLSDLYFPEDCWYAEEGDTFLRLIYGNVGIMINQVLIDYSSGKAAFGESGATAKLWRMQIGELRNYFRALKRGHLNILLYMLLIVFSFLKFLRRVVLTKIKRQQK